MNEKEILTLVKGLSPDQLKQIVLLAQENNDEHITEEEIIEHIKIVTGTEK